MPGALAGIRVLDLSRVLAGPWASQLLADYGADVIKVERPATGDDTRHWGPPWLADADGNATSESAYFLASNRNKRSVTVDISTPGGQTIVRDLAAGSDIFLENFRVGALQPFGLDAASLRARFPRLIYCSISAYGQDGPRAGEAGYDAMIQASAGLMSVTGERAGPPLKTGVAVADLMAGMYAVTAILAALHARGTDGSGQHIDIPLFDTQLAWLANQAMNYLVSHEVPARLGNAHPNIVPYQSFATADSYLMLAVGNDRQFAACLECLELQELATDKRFRSNALRVAHRAELIPLMEQRFATQATDTWLTLFASAGVPCGPVNDLQQVFDSEQVVARQLLASLPHPLAGSVPAVANPVRFSATPATLRSAPPLLGEHTSDVLENVLGYSVERIDELRGNGAI
ncbi:MAG: CaiB/BaiF CoA-transferase family protein [Woeseia sp.]